jgi:hypothetical protein
MQKLKGNKFIERIYRNLNLGLQPRQGLARVQAKREAREAHLMLSGVHESVRERTFTLPMSSYFGSWNPNGLLNFQKKL